MFQITSYVKKMTERGKQWLTNGGFSKLTLLLLSVIGSGVGWLIVQNNTRLNVLEKEQQQQELRLNDLTNISSNLIEAYNIKADKDKDQDKEILELWKCAKRSATNKLITE